MTDDALAIFNSATHVSTRIHVTQSDIDAGGNTRTNCPVYRAVAPLLRYRVRLLVGRDRIRLVGRGQDVEIALPDIACGFISRQDSRKFVPELEPPAPITFWLDLPTWAL